MQSLSEESFLKLIDNLRKSSEAAISDGLDSNVSEFEKYIYEQREIDRELERVFEEADKKDRALIIILGRVGEGKSRLLKNLRTKFPNQIDAWQIFNDGTESHDPEKDYIETLDSLVLKPYTDLNISHANTKTILAINIGPLDNLKLRRGDSYTSLFEKLNNFDEKITRNDWLFCINLLKIPIFEYQETGIKSQIIDSIYDKIFSQDSNNPFLQSLTKNYSEVPDFYKKNYEFLAQTTTKKIILTLLLESMVMNKYFLNIRMFFNFLYTLITLDTSSNDFPFAIFESENDDQIQKEIKKLDPCKLRNMENEFNILSECYKEGKFDTHKAKQIVRKNHFNELSKKQDKFILFEKLLCFANGCSNLRQDVGSIVRDLVIPSISSWNGRMGPKTKNLIVIPYFNTKKYRVAKEVEFELSNIVSKGVYEVELIFRTKGQKELSILIDYNLFSLLHDIHNGYVPNPYDKAKFMLLNKLVDDLLKSNDTNKMFVDLKNDLKPIDFQFEVSKFMNEDQLKYSNYEG